MKDLTISYERVDNIYIALDMKPDGDYQAVFDRLDQLVQKDLLGFETCEERIEGSFDDILEEDET